MDDLSQALESTSSQNPDNDIARLKRAYINEKCAPELLPFQGELLARVTEQVEQQEATVSSSRAAAAAGGGSGGGGGGAVDDLMAHIYHAELNRVRFMLRAYYRTRLFKIEQHVVHVVKEEEVFARLSAREQEYATGYTNMVEEHFGSVLGQLPERYTSMLQQIEEDEGEFDMVPEPSLDKHVFCRVKEDRGACHVNTAGRSVCARPYCWDFIIDPDDPENTLDLVHNDIIMVRYRFIKALLEEDAVELI